MYSLVLCRFVRLYSGAVVSAKFREKLYFCLEIDEEYADISANRTPKTIPSINKFIFYGAYSTKVISAFGALS